MNERITIPTQDQVFKVGLNSVLARQPRIVDVSRRRDVPGSDRRYVALHGLRLALGLVAFGTDFVYRDSTWTVMPQKGAAKMVAHDYAAPRLGTIRGGGDDHVGPFTTVHLTGVERLLPTPRMRLADELHAVGVVAEFDPGWEAPNDLPDGQHPPLPLREALTPLSFQRLGALLEIDAAVLAPPQG